VEGVRRRAVVAAEKSVVACRSEAPPHGLNLAAVSACHTVPGRPDLAAGRPVFHRPTREPLALGRNPFNPVSNLPIPVRAEQCA